MDVSSAGPEESRGGIYRVEDEEDVEHDAEGTRNAVWAIAQKMIKGTGLCKHDLLKPVIGAPYCIFPFLRSLVVLSHCPPKSLSLCYLRWQCREPQSGLAPPELPPLTLGCVRHVGLRNGRISVHESTLSLVKYLESHDRGYLASYPCRSIR